MARPECEKARQFKLSADYYKGDRSMRESGFDVSFRFGRVWRRPRITIAPVCLNSLLYKTEKDLEQISRWLGHARRRGEMEQARGRAQEADHALSVERSSRDMFFDFNFRRARCRRTGMRRRFIRCGRGWPRRSRQRRLRQT